MWAGVRPGSEGDAAPCRRAPRREGKGRQGKGRRLRLLGASSSPRPRTLHHTDPPPPARDGVARDGAFSCDPGADATSPGADVVCPKRACCPPGVRLSVARPRVVELFFCAKRPRQAFSCGGSAGLGPQWAGRAGCGPRCSFRGAAAAAWSARRAFAANRTSTAHRAAPIALGVRTRCRRDVEAPWQCWWGTRRHGFWPLSSALLLSFAVLLWLVVGKTSGNRG